jgi:hypothetical protein
MNPALVLRVLTNPWVLAASGGAAGYMLWKKNRDQRGRLKDARLEMLEQQRTIDRLRAELARERHQRLDDKNNRPY